MKKCLTLCSLFLFGTLLFAQSDKHILFKGFPLDGAITAFNNKLKDSGFIAHPDASQYTKDALLKGTFAGLDNCTIRVLATPKTKTVYRVEVSTDNYTDWYSTETAYKGLINTYAEKYIQSSQCDFISYPYNSVNGWEIKAIFQDKYSLFTYFKAEGGEICISVEAENESKAYIKITYEDKQNKELNKTESSAVALDDI